MARKFAGIFDGRIRRDFPNSDSDCRASASLAILPQTAAPKAFACTSAKASDLNLPKEVTGGRAEREELRSRMRDRKRAARMEDGRILTQSRKGEQDEQAEYAARRASGLTVFDLASPGGGSETPSKGADEGSDFFDRILQDCRT